jgi:tetratricopeptide (TPR) repeat protein
MMMVKKIFTVAAATFLIISTSVSQSTTALYQQGLSFEREFRDREALAKFHDVLERDPLHQGALTHASRMLSNVAGRANHAPIKLSCARRASSLAQKAIQLDSANKDAHLNYVIALGLLAEVASSSREKIQHAKVIHREALIMLKLDSGFAPAFYILGKLNLSLATLTWLEKLACKVLFGQTFDEASVEDAVGYFNKAIALKPDYILFHYNKALAYYYSSNYQEAKRCLLYATALEQQEPDDKFRLNQCHVLLKKISHQEI